MVILAAEKQLIRDIPNMLDPKVFGRMEDDALNALAGEAPGIRERRKTLASEKEELERGLELCQKYRWRSGGTYLRYRNHSLRKADMGFAAGAGILSRPTPTNGEKVGTANVLTNGVTSGVTNGVKVENQETTNGVEEEEL